MDAVLRRLRSAEALGDADFKDMALRDAAALLKDTELHCDWSGLAKALLLELDGSGRGELVLTCLERLAARDPLGLTQTLLSELRVGDKLVLVRALQRVLVGATESERLEEVTELLIDAVREHMPLNPQGIRDEELALSLVQLMMDLICSRSLQELIRTGTLEESWLDWILSRIPDRKNSRQLNRKLGQCFVLVVKTCSDQVAYKWFSLIQSKWMQSSCPQDRCKWIYLLSLLLDNVQNRFSEFVDPILGRAAQDLPALCVQADYDSAVLHLEVLSVVSIHLNLSVS
jgi:hypothetical protein